MGTESDRAACELVKRTRSIKPGFTEDTDLAEVSIVGRYLYENLFCRIDMDGVTEDNPKLIKREIFPYDDMTVLRVEKLLSELVDHGFLFRFTYDGKKYFYCPKFSVHQRFHKDEKPYYLIPKDIVDAAVLTPLQHGAGTTTAPLQHGANSPLICNLESVICNPEYVIPNLCAVTPPHPRGGDLVDAWQKHSGPLPKINPATLKQFELTKIRERLEENPNIADWENAIKKMAGNPYFAGKNKIKWVGDFLWLIDPGNLNKVLNREYTALEDDAASPPAKLDSSRWT